MVYKAARRGTSTVALGEESRWCKTAAMSSLVGLLSTGTDNPIDLPSAPNSSPFPETAAYSHPCASTTIPSHFVPILKDPLPILFKLLADQNVYGMFDFCQQATCSEYCSFALIRDLAFQAGKLFAQWEKVSRTNGRYF
jgi:hypothetical protein